MKCKVKYTKRERNRKKASKNRLEYRSSWSPYTNTGIRAGKPSVAAGNDSIGMEVKVYDRHENSHLCP
jgi:hypothetical protein